MISLSPGLLQSCVELLRLISRSQLTVMEIRNSFMSFGNIPMGEILETTQALKWLSVTEESVAVVTAGGSRLLDATGYERMLRRAILDYVEIERPPWLQQALNGRARVLAFSGPKVAQVMIEAGLKAGVSADVVEFWDELAARARGLRDARLTAIGRLGERCTLAHEEARTGVVPKWVSLEDNDDGYDVLSINNREDRKPLSIETKTSTLGSRGLFHMTKNEWERALESELHVFHLWDVSNNDVPRLAVISPEDMKAHIPDDCGSGEWEIARIPFRAFGDCFHSVPLTT